MNRGIQGAGGSVEAKMMKTVMKKQLFFEAIEIFFYIDFSTFANKMTM